jgi:hypothetical protein
MKRIFQIMTNRNCGRFHGLLALACLLSCVAGCASGAKTAEDCGPWQPGYATTAQKFLQSEVVGHSSTELSPEAPVLGQVKKDHYSGIAWRYKVWVREKDGPGQKDYSQPKPYWFFFARGDLICKVKPSDVPDSEWPR